MVKEEEYLLTNQEILGGLKAAIGRGQSLKQAMMSFYQSGYKKEEIEDAARAYLYLQKGNSEAQVLNKNPLNESSKKETNKKIKKGFFGSKKKDEKQFSAIAKTKAPSSIERKEPEEKKKIVQKISSYESPKNVSVKLKSKALTTVLVVTLIVLVIILGLIFLFKAELVNFINGLFG